MFVHTNLRSFIVALRKKNELIEIHTEVDHSSTGLYRISPTKEHNLGMYRIQIHDMGEGQLTLTKFLMVSDVE